jgi:hypothetical protein
MCIKEQSYKGRDYKPVIPLIEQEKSYRFRDYKQVTNLIVDQVVLGLEQQLVLDLID